MKVILSDKEWMGIIDKNRSGLPICCSLISDLRDIMIEIAREGGEYCENDKKEIIGLWDEICKVHDTSRLLIMKKVIRQIKRKVDIAGGK